MPVEHFLHNTESEFWGEFTMILLPKNYKKSIFQMMCNVIKLSTK